MQSREVGKHRNTMLPPCGTLHAAPVSLACHFTHLRTILFRVPQMRDTGVRFEDIAGMEFLVTEMREIVRMLKGDEAYKRVGAKCPKGIIFQVCRKCMYVDSAPAICHDVWEGLCLAGQ